MPRTTQTGELIQGYAPDNTQETILCVFSTFCQVSKSRQTN